MYTISELELMKRRTEATLGGMVLSKEQALLLIEQTIQTQRTIQDLIDFMSLMARKGSSWGPQIQKKLNEYLFDGADEDTIKAAIALLGKHRNVTVDDLLQTLASKLNTAKPNENNNARVMPVAFDKNRFNNR
jgi:hypothetical protein